MNTLEQQFKKEFDSYQKYCDALFVVITRLENSSYLKDGLIEEAKTIGSITKRLTRSEEFDNSTLIKVSSSVTANEELAPN